jgi:hypothetical protein
MSWRVAHLRAGLMVLLAAVVLVACLAARVGTSPASSYDGRAAVDLPDERVGPQVHLLYVTPRDGVDRNLDSNGTIDQWMTSFNSWIATQPEGVPIRVDTINGHADVSFVQLHESAETIAAGGTSLGAIGNELRADGFSDPAKKYLAFYEGYASNGWCGTSGQIGVIYLAGPCSDRMDMLAGHEIFHLLGAVNACAPHVDTSTGDTQGDSSDLMNFAVPTRSLARLDPGHDDYWGPASDDHLPASCASTANVATSDYLVDHPFYRVHVDAQGGGSVSISPPTGFRLCPPSSSCEVAAGKDAQLTLSSTPDPGHHFVGWSGVPCDVPSPTTCSIRVTADLKVTAAFARDPYLVLTIGGKGRVTIPDVTGTCAKRRCRLQVPFRQRLALVAIPATGWRLLRWGGVCGARSPTCAVTLRADARVGVTFVRARRP